MCETYGKYPLTGALLEKTEYRSLDPLGKAIIMAADYLPPYENPSEDYPFLLTTGRTI